MRDDFRAGQICATVANYAGKMRSDEAGPAQPFDFMPSLLSQVQRPPAEPVLLKDPKAQAALMRKTLFGKDE